MNLSNSMPFISIYMFKKIMVDVDVALVISF